MGWTDGPAFTLTRRLYTNDSGTCVTNEIVCWGSKPVPGSLWNVNLRVPPRFGVCVSAGVALSWGPVIAMTATPPALRMSRRVMEAGHSFMGVSSSQPSSPRTPGCWTVQSAVAEDLELNRTRCQQQVRAQNAPDLAAVGEHAEPQAMADYRDHLTGLSGARSLSRWGRPPH